MSEGSGLEIYQPRRVEGIAAIAGLKVEMGACRPAGVSSEGNGVAGVDPLSRLNQTARKVAVIGLQPVCMTDDHEVSVPSDMLGVAYLAVECGKDGGPDRVGEVNTLMGPAVATHRFFGTLNRIERSLNRG